MTMPKQRPQPVSRTASWRPRSGASLCAGLAAVLAPFAQPAPAADPLPPPPPSFVVFLTDDQGWSGTSVQMDDAVPGSSRSFLRTPRLAEMAARGVRFSQAYAAAPNCTPTRASLQSGISPAALRMTDIIGKMAIKRQTKVRPLFVPPVQDALPDEVETIAERLKKHRPEYVTGHLGKWHLSGGGPARHGYDIHSGDTFNGDGKGSAKDPKHVYRLTRESHEFLAARARDARPFFLQVSHYAIHKPIEARPALRDRYAAEFPDDPRVDPGIAALTEHLDESLGSVLDSLDALGLAENTFVFFVSDNGAVSEQGGVTNAPLARGKSTLREGGLRVPMVVQGPGVARGEISPAPVISWDFLPTISELAGIQAPLAEAVEGGSFASVLRQPKGATIARRNPFLAWHLPHYFPKNETVPVSAIRSGPFKLLRFWDGSPPLLFDLRTDLGEQRSIAATHPAELRRLQGEIDDYLEAVGASLPRENPAHRKRPSEKPSVSDPGE